ncbi:MAG: DUF697 domain-containing protein [Rubrobacteraceae bacterium]
MTGNSPRASEIAALLGAERGSLGAEVILRVPEGGGRLALSGKAVEDPDDLELSAVREDAVQGELVSRIVRALEDEYVIPLGRGYPVFRRAVCEEIIYKNARENAVIGALPIPGADMPVMTANQGRMVLSIASVYGEDLSLERAREMLGVLAAGFGLRAVSRQVVKLVPVGGWAAAAAIGYAGTITMGRATVLYFERGGQQVGQKEMAEIQHRATEEAKTFVSRFRRK